MTRTAMLAGALLLALAIPAGAADQAPPVTKAPPPAPVFTGYGFYGGLNFGGDAGTVNATVAPSGQAGTFTKASGQMGLTLGYAWALSGDSWVGIEAEFDAVANMANGLGGLSVRSPMIFEQRALYGGGVFDTLQSTLAGLINLGPLPPYGGLIPAGSTAVNNKMYGFVGLFERDLAADIGGVSSKSWQIGGEAGMGQRTFYSKGFATDVKAGVRFGDKSLCVLPTGTAACAGMNPTGFVTFALLY